MSSEELAEIEAGAKRYHTMSSEVVKRLVAEVRELKSKYEGRTPIYRQSTCASKPGAV